MTSMRNDFQVTDADTSEQAKFAEENRAKHKAFHIKMRYEPSLHPYSTATTEALQQTAETEQYAKVEPIDNKLRQSHVIVSQSNQGMYVSEAASSYVPHATGDAYAVNQETVKNLRKSHWNPGEGKGDYSTTFNTYIKSHDDYVEDGKYIGQSRKYDEYVYL